jgi:hypothetical protein
VARLCNTFRTPSVAELGILSGKVCLVDGLTGFHLLVDQIMILKFFVGFTHGSEQGFPIPTPVQTGLGYLATLDHIPSSNALEPKSTVLGNLRTT